MNIYKKVFSGCFVLVSSLLLISCGQSSDNQSGSLDGNQSDSVTVAGKAVPSVALSDGDVHVYKGEVFTLDLTMSDFTVSEGGGVTLRFDPLLLQVTNVDIDKAVWSFVNKEGQINNAEGTVSDILFSSYQGISGNVKVATIEFKSIEKGTSTITLETSPINPFAGDGKVLVVMLNTTNVFSN